MTLLDRYLGRRLISLLVKIMLSLVLLFVLVDLLTHRADNITEFDIPLHIVALYYLALAPMILFKFQAAALAVLVAGLMVLGRAAQDNEVTAALAGGISLRRLARAPLTVALGMSLLAFALEEGPGTRATAKAAEIERKYFSKFSEDDRRGVSWTNLEGGWTCHVLKFNRVALTGEDVILKMISPDLAVDILADRIYWDETRGQWLLENGVRLDTYPLNEMNYTTTRITQAPAPFTEPPEALFALEAPADTKTAARLRSDLERAASLGMRTDKYWIEYYNKFARPALCFIMMLLALPFAIRLRRGGLSVGFGLSIAIGTAYVLVFYASAGLGYLEVLSPFVAAWFANAVFLIIGLTLFTRTPT
ncbi:MAG: LptF/LptG family permease [Candidatus Hydrogenedentes bacterium]|nr:LptF/LptG family permease [Candidatus Hydrogenedentota bacterium]